MFFNALNSCLIITGFVPIIVYLIAVLFSLRAPIIKTTTSNETTMFVPVHSLRKVDICSVISIALAPTTEDWRRRVDYHHSRRTMFQFLLSIYSSPNNNDLLNWIDECSPSSKINWTTVQNNYTTLQNIIEPYQLRNNAGKLGTYWEMKIDVHESGPKQSRSYINRYRSNGFQPNELKLYWNYEQIRDIIKKEYHNPIRDTDARNTLIKFPVDTRDHPGTIHFIRAGIQNAVFQVPSNKQIIVLDFADERMPGGYFIENANTQEEVILFNSDGYRALLDLKYTMMNGGYILPEYGVAYVKHVRFFQEKTKEERLTDLIVAACYDMSSAGEGLYKPPSHKEQAQLRDRTLQKFRALIASAVANTEDSGKNTYLLLGPIGTGAFGNDMKMIAELFSKVLNESLMDSKKAIRYAFEQIWFVSIGSLQVFEQVFKKTG